MARPQPDDADREGITIVIRKILEGGKVKPRPNSRQQAEGSHLPSEPLTIEHQVGGLAAGLRPPARG
jgi:hypothetical protein